MQSTTKSIGYGRQRRSDRGYYRLANSIVANTAGGGGGRVCITCNDYRRFAESEKPYDTALPQHLTELKISTPSMYV